MDFSYSFVIPTFNSSKTIRKCVQSIQASANFANVDFEIIVVDNYSTDSTSKILQSLKCEVPCLKVFQRGPERSEQRNFGVENSYGSIICYVDSDMYFGTKLVTAVDKWFRAQPTRSFAKVSEVMLGNSLFNSVRRFERTMYENTSIDSPRFIKREIFAVLGGFLPGIPGSEDWELDERLYNLERSFSKNFVEETSTKKMENSIPPQTFPTIFHDEALLDFWTFLAKKKYYLASNAYMLGQLKNFIYIRPNFSVYHRLFGIPLSTGSRRFVLNLAYLYFAFLVYKAIQFGYSLIWLMVGRKHGN